jgi:hypothetical protein
MGTQRSTFSKLQRDRDKKAKAAAKREQRLERSSAAGEAPAGDTATEHDAESSARLLELIEQVHRQYDAHQIGQDEFEERKAALLAQLRID